LLQQSGWLWLDSSGFQTRCSSGAHVKIRIGTPRNVEMTAFAQISTDYDNPTPRLSSRLECFVKVAVSGGSTSGIRRAITEDFPINRRCPIVCIQIFFLSPFLPYRNTAAAAALRFNTANSMALDFSGFDPPLEVDEASPLPSLHAGSKSLAATAAASSSAVASSSSSSSAAGAQRACDADPDGEPFSFHLFTPNMALASRCMWSAGRLGNLAAHVRKPVTFEGKTYHVQLIVLPATRIHHGPNETTPGAPTGCLWPVFFRGQLSRDPRTEESVRAHMTRNPMGNLSTSDTISWFATDPATAIVYGYPDAYTVQPGLELYLLDVSDPSTVAFVQAWYKSHRIHKQVLERGNKAFNASAAETAFILHEQSGHVERNSEWTADNDVAQVLAHSHSLLTDLNIDGWALDRTGMHHTEIMLIHPSHKLQFMGSLFGKWSKSAVDSITRKYVDLQAILRRTKGKSKDFFARTLARTEETTGSSIGRRDRSFLLGPGEESGNEEAGDDKEHSNSNRTGGIAVLQHATIPFQVTHASAMDSPPKRARTAQAFSTPPRRSAAAIPFALSDSP
jgi:hypothetical protein